MGWEIEFSDEFGEWWDSLTMEEQKSISVGVELLRDQGASLGYPWTSAVRSSRVSHMRELRVQHAGRPYRVLYAFDPRRAGLLLIGGDKTGNDRWYEEFVPRAENIYFAIIAQLRKERLI